MKKLIVLLCLIFIPALTASDTSTYVLAVSGQGAGGEPTTACVGFEADQSSCDFDTDPGADGSSTSDATRARTWTATRNGTLSRVKIWTREAGGSCDAFNLDAVAYVNDVLVATATLACGETEGYVWSGYFVAESGQSLDFSTDDVVKYGFTVDADSTHDIVFGRQADSGADKNYYATTAYMDADPSWSTSNYELGAILEYTYTP